MSHDHITYLALQEHGGLEIDDFVSNPRLEVNSPGAIADVSRDGFELERFSGEHDLVDVRHDLGGLVSVGENIEEVRLAGEVKPWKDALLSAA